MPSMVLILVSAVTTLALMGNALCGVEHLPAAQHVGTVKHILSESGCTSVLTLCSSHWLSCKDVNSCVDTEDTVEFCLWATEVLLNYKTSCTFLLSTVLILVDHPHKLWLVPSCYAHKWHKTYMVTEHLKSPIPEKICGDFMLAFSVDD